MTTRLSVIVILLLMASVAPAQDQPAAGNMVVFDPLFWKERLKLNSEQCQRIREINSTFYRKLSDVASESNHQVVKARAAQTLLERSEEIWETFDSKQRRRWKKIAEEAAI